MHAASQLLSEHSRVMCRFLSRDKDACQDQGPNGEVARNIFMVHFCYRGEASGGRYLNLGNCFGEKPYKANNTHETHTRWYMLTAEAALKLAVLSACCHFWLQNHARMCARRRTTTWRRLRQQSRTGRWPTEQRQRSSSSRCEAALTAASMS